MNPGIGRTLRAGNGRRVMLGELLKSGGAGSVYRLRDDSELVAKIYHDYVDHGLYQRKVAAMLSLSPSLPDLLEKTGRYVQIAWPTDLLYAERSRFVGFLMPAVDVKATSELECVLQERQARMHGLPTGLGAKITLAANLAAVIAELHRQDHRVVDLKPVNLRFYPQSLYMAMLDCDGFSIQGDDERFPAPQYTPEYMAPEFHANGITVAGEEQQDRFALAVIVFQLLNFGIHPYTGRPSSERVPTDIPGRIAGRFHAYGLRPNAHLRPSVVSGHLAMPLELRQLFDRAFDGPAITRPPALEWASALRGYAQRSNLRLATCRSDAEHQHFAGLPCAACTRADLIAQTAQKNRAAKSAAASPVDPLRAIGLRARTTQARARTQTPPQTRTNPNAHAAAPYARTAQQKRWQRPPPPPMRPLPLPTPPTLNNPLGWWVLKNFWPLILALVFFVCQFVVNLVEKAMTHDPAMSPTYTATPAERLHAERPTEGSPPPETEMPAPAEPVAASTIEISRQLRDARPHALAVAAASSYNNEHVVQRGLSHLMGLRAHDFSADSYARDQAATRFKAFMHIVTHAEDKDRVYHMTDLETYLERFPYDAEAACEWGWLALMEGKREQAEDAFVRAIWADPAFGGGWYGLGAVTTEDGARLGALVMARRFDAYASVESLQLEKFTASVLDRANIDSLAWRAIQRRAQQRAMQDPSR